MRRVRMSVKENCLRDPSRVTQADYERFVSESGAGWVEEREGRVVGFAVADRMSRSIWALFVEPQFEGLGIGRLLLRQVTDHLIATGSGAINLSTEPGTRAERVYRAAGWTQVGVLPSGEAWLVLRESRAR